MWLVESAVGYLPERSEKVWPEFHVFNCRTLEPQFVVMSDMENKDIFFLFVILLSVFLPIVISKLCPIFKDLEFLGLWEDYF